MKNVIFYSRSKKDINSPKLISIIKQSPFKNEFVYFCIDPDPVTKNQNKDLLFILDINEVPTMYVNGEKYVGIDEAFMWLKNIHEQEQSYQRKQQITQQITQNPMQKQPLPMQRQPIDPRQNDEGILLGNDSNDMGCASIENFQPPSQQFGEDWLKPVQTKNDGNASMQFDNKLEQMRNNYLGELKTNSRI